MWPKSTMMETYSPNEDFIIFKMYTVINAFTEKVIQYSELNRRWGEGR